MSLKKRISSSAGCSRKNPTARAGVNVTMTESYLFARTREGDIAIRRAECRLPDDYRAVLESLRGVMAFASLAQRLPQLPRARIAACIDDLQAIGLIESVPLEWLRALHLVAERAQR